MEEEYNIFEPGVSAPLHTLSRIIAREHFDHVMSSYESRMFELSRITKSSNIDLDLSCGSIAKLNKFLIKLASEKNNSIDPDVIVFSVCNDIALYLGKYVISLVEGVKWELLTKPKSDLRYHRPVLKGFRKKRKDYYIDYDLLLCQYAYRIMDNEYDENLLLDLVEFVEHE